MSQGSLKAPEGSIVVQRDLMPGRLNVAGEFHPDSNMQRNEEVAFMKEKLGKKSTYWREHEFHTNKGEWADPKHLRLAQIAATWPSLNTHLDTIIRLIEKHRDAWARPPVPVGQADGRKLISNVLNGLPDFYALLHVEEVELAADDALLVDVRGECQDLSMLWGKVKQAIDTAKYERDSGNSVNCDGLVTTLKLLRESLHMIASTVNSKHGSDGDTIRMKRSEAMHAAANAGVNQVGLWKVGDAHVTDIMAMHEKDQRQYHLMTRQEFIGDFTKPQKGGFCIVQ